MSQGNTERIKNQTGTTSAIHETHSRPPFLYQSAGKNRAGHNRSELPRWVLCKLLIHIMMMIPILNQCSEAIQYDFSNQPS